MIVRDMNLMKGICVQLMQGLGTMHNAAQFAHMDIKLENILLTD
jgi:serine/threonine protein kinase